MPKITVKCMSCGKTFEKYTYSIKNGHTFCSHSCSAKWQHANGKLGTSIIKARRKWKRNSNKNRKYCEEKAWKVWARMEIREKLFDESRLRPQKYEYKWRGVELCRGKNISPCYLKEAKAMLGGKHWEGKNRCVKLEGD